MKNAKQEFLEQISDRGLLCASITYRDYDILLKKNYSEKELQAFLNRLDFQYFNGYGSQELFGTIWHTNKTWSERIAHDGKECWDFKQIPAIPQNLKH